MQAFDALRAFRDARGVLDEFLADPASGQFLHRIIDLTAGALSAGNKVLACGNGGSLCDAMHVCEEFTGRFRKTRPALPALACADPGHLSCVANDFGYDNVFSRFVEAHGRAGDVLILLSTSGNSPNCLLAAREARARGVLTIALLGKGGGQLRGACDEALVAPGQTADRIQELHMLVLHALVEGVEHRLGYA